MVSMVSGKSVIITGAASGVGLAIARRFVENGANVLMADKDEAQLDQEVEALSGNEGKVQAFSGDFCQKLTINNLLASAIDAYDRIDILVNANRLVEEFDPLEGDIAAFENMMTTNVTANLRLSQAVARRMIQQAKSVDSEGQIGAIVNLTSIAARQTLPGLVSFSVASAALEQLTRSLAVAYAQYGIRVNAIALGSVMSGSLRETLNHDEDLLADLIDATPMGRIGEAVEAAEAAMFLASHCASFMTGQVLTVDGGRSLLDRLNRLGH